jgi:hypothetical protein
MHTTKYGGTRWIYFNTKESLEKLKILMCGMDKSPRIIRKNNDRRY